MSAYLSFDPKDYGAVPDGKTVNTEAIQKAIDAASGQGGGVVEVGPGTWLTGTLFLRDHLTLRLGPGAVLKASPDMKHFPRMDHNLRTKDEQPYHFLYADKVRHVTIEGPGTIDGSDRAFWEPEPVERAVMTWFKEKSERPSPMVDFSECEDIIVRDISLVHSPGWTLSVKESKRVLIDGIRIDNNLGGPNTDGIDVTDSCDVRIANCHISTADDAIVLKSFGGVCERITVTGCVVRSSCSAYKLGAMESLGIIRQVLFNGCISYGSSRTIHVLNCFGGLFEDIVYDGIVCGHDEKFGLVNPIHVSTSRFEHSERYDPEKHPRGNVLGRIHNLSISNVLVPTSKRIFLSAEEPGSIENVRLSNIQVEMPFIDIPGERARKAKSDQYSPAPSQTEARATEAAIVAHNIDNLTLSDIDVRWPKEGEVPDYPFLWARGLRGGYARCPAASASKLGVEVTDIENCENFRWLES